jgi:hypothetical protein
MNTYKVDIACVRYFNYRYEVTANSYDEAQDKALQRADDDNSQGILGECVALDLFVNDLEQTNQLEMFEKNVIPLPTKLTEQHLALQQTLQHQPIQSQ